MSQFNAFQKAAKAWPILTRAARDGQPLTYGGLARALGIHHRPIKYVLSEIQDYCLREKLPPLTILVQNASGLVGKGFIAWDADDIETGRNLVYAENWANHPNPFTFAIDGDSPDQIASGIAAGTISAMEAYARVKVRGMAQVVFRKAMIKIYNGRCAFSGHAGEPLMQAAHIIPWGRCTPPERLDPRNGILLSVQHHRMFDLDWIRITPDYRIRVNWDAIKGYALAVDQRKALSVVDGAMIRLPADKKHYPAQELIRRRYADEKMLRELQAFDM